MGVDLRTCQTQHVDVPLSDAEHLATVEAIERRYTASKAAATLRTDTANAGVHSAAANSSTAGSNPSDGPSSPGATIIAVLPAGPGGGGDPPQSGGGDPPRGTPPRTEYLSGYFYDKKHFDQVQPGEANRGVTGDDVAALPGEAQWKARSFDRLREEPATAYFDNDSCVHYTVYNHARDEVVQVANRTKDDWAADKALGPRQVSMLRYALKWLRREHHRPFAVRPEMIGGPRRVRRVAGYNRSSISL